MLPNVRESDLRIPVQADDFADICSTIDSICVKFPAKYWRDLEYRRAQERFPDSFVAALGEAGIFGALVPEECGGIDLPVAAVAKIIETIHRCGCNGSIAIAQFELSYLIAQAGSEEMKATILPKLAEGSAKIISLARQTDDRNEIRASVSVNGVTISGASTRVLAPKSTDYLIVATSENQGTSLFIVDLKAASNKALVIDPVREMTATNVADVRFDLLEVPVESRIGQPAAGAAVLAKAEVLRRILETSAAIGDGRFFSRRGAQYANDRVVFGKPIGTYQGIQFPLARAHIEVEAAFIGLRKAVELFDSGNDADIAASVAHHLAMEAAWNMADAAFTTHGGFAFAREYDIERKWRDVRAARISGCASDDDLRRIGTAELRFSRLD